MDISAWVLMSVLLKLGIYLCACVAIGAPFIRYLVLTQALDKERQLEYSISRYYGRLIFLGATFSVFNFYVQVGAFAEQGVSGMFNADLAVMLWQSAVGDMMLFQLSGFLVIGVSQSVGQISVSQGLSFNSRYVSAVLFLTGLTLLALSFSMVGHTLEHGFMARIILSMHLLVVAWWIGTLFPLKSACRFLNVDSIFQLMEIFGKIASYIVAILVICGVTLVIVIADFKLDIFYQVYGWLLLAKLTLVAGMLMVALYHKLKLVPSLKEESGAALKLEKSISREILLAMMILLFTALLTLVVSP
ncbi:copper resistance D family protein [Aliikangiella sp. G2MR2-5]|uniref:copper resistance D family protein n=1 Tax=Aliikangiella sp. G2MR2-5 TaxID=2788943 RepID=UPI0018AA7B85|nr:CopD family protein [Aliikangiella sp. G2MR2-5]